MLGGLSRSLEIQYPPDDMAFDAFISYSSKDKATADATCATLETAGIRCWIAPRDIIPGSEYGAAIVDAIDHCRVVILVFSSSANASQQIHREIERAVNRGLPIIPLRIEETMPTESMAYFMESVHWLDAMNPPLEAHLQRLGESLKLLLHMNSDTEYAPLPNRLSPSGPPPLSFSGEIGLRPQGVMNSPTAPAIPVRAASRRSVTKSIIRIIAMVTIAALVGLGCISLLAAMDTLRKSADIATMLGCGIIAAASFVPAYLIYEFGIRRRSM